MSKNYIVEFRKCEDGYNWKCEVLPNFLLQGAGVQNGIFTDTELKERLVREVCFDICSVERLGIKKDTEFYGTRLREVLMRKGFDDKKSREIRQNLIIKYA